MAPAHAGADAFVLAATEGRRARAEALLKDEPASAGRHWCWDGASGRATRTSRAGRAVAEALVAAGTTVESALLDVADGPLAEWLDRRLR